MLVIGAAIDERLAPGASEKAFCARAGSIRGRPRTTSEQAPRQTAFGTEILVNTVYVMYLSIRN